MYQRTALVALIVTGSLGLSACNDSDSDHPPAPAANASVRVVHASSDAPAVNVRVNGDVAVTAADYRQAATLAPSPGTYSIAVDGLLPGNQSATVIGPVSLTFEANRQYDVIAVGSVADATLEPLVLDTPITPVSAGNVRVRVAHLASAAPEVDVYVSAPDAELTGTSPLGRFAFKGTLGPVEVPAASYRIRVTLADTSSVVFDSGELALSAGQDLLIGAINNTGGGLSPVNLLVLDGATASTVYDAASGADIRVVHNAADAPAVDVLLDNVAAISNLAFPDVAPAVGYANVGEGPVNVKVVPAGAQADAAVITADLDLMRGAQYTVLAVNSLSAIEPLVLADDNRGLATAAKLRVVHGSTLAGPVDVYAVAPGAGIGNSTPALSNVPFKANSGYLQLAEGSYDLIVTPAGNPSIQAIGPLTVSLQAGSVYTVVARDGAGLTTPLGVTVLDAFTN